MLSAGITKTLPCGRRWTFFIASGRGDAILFPCILGVATGSEGVKVTRGKEARPETSGRRTSSICLEEEGAIEMFIRLGPATRKDSLSRTLQKKAKEVVELLRTVRVMGRGDPTVAAGG